MINDTNKFHVIFGTGPVGMTLADELLAQGDRVRLVNRSGRVTSPTAAEVVRGDAMNFDVVQALTHGADVVYNCTHAPYESWPEILPRLQENMIEGAAAAGAKLVVIDTLYLYGATQGQPMTESMAHNATTRKGRLRAELAWGYLQAHRVGKVRVAIGRAADFFGPRALNSALGQYFFPAALAGQPVGTFGNIDLPHSYSYMPDVAKGLALLGAREDALGQQWHLPVAPVTTTRAICQMLGEMLGAPLPILNVESIAQAQAMHIFDDVFAREYTELFYQYLEPQIVDASAMAQQFGLHATPLATALQTTLDWYRQQATQPA